MTINQYVKKWCDESYDVRKEDFFVENAEYIVERQWAEGGRKHGIFGAIAALLVATFCGQSGLPALIYGLSILGVSAICFWFFAIRRYDANTTEISTGLYIALAYVLITLLKIVPVGYQALFAIPTTVLYVYQSIIRPSKFKKMKERMKQRMAEEAEEEDRRAKQTHAQWESEYKSYRYGIPENTSASSDPFMEKARAMFIGFTENKQMLKARYRQMAKQYHPDVGGDTKMFQCIIAAYEELCQQVA